VAATKEVFGVQGTGQKADRFLTRSVRANGLVFTTLHHGWDPADYDPTIESGTLPDDLAAQTRNVLEVLGTVLAEAGSGLDRVLRANVYVNAPELDALEQVDAAYHAFFRDRRLDEPPLRTTTRVELMDPGVAMDIVAAA
jgi:2-iminobutanoate/2-iminopropanoate deaminase